MSHSAISGLFIVFAIFVMGMMAFSLIMFGSVAAIFRKAFKDAKRNETLPMQQAAARVVAKRSQVTGMDMTSTWYYATFELANGERREFSLSGPEYGLLAEGDEGRLTYQGTLFRHFDRQPAAAPPVMAAPANT